MVPWAADTQFFQFPKKAGPYRIALANGYIANTWRIQMVQTAKAYAEQPDVKAKLKEFKVVSTGEDVPAQISAINNFIDSGYDAIVVDAQNPTAFGPVIKRAKEAGVVLVAFDNTLDTKDAINVDVDQKGLGVLWANWLIEHLPNGGKILEVRGVAGTSVDTDRHNGIAETLKASGKAFNVTEVVGKWDDGVAQKATADAFATNGPFDGYHGAGRRHRRGARHDGRQAEVRAVRRRDRERLPQALRRARRRRPEVRIRRHRPGAGRGRDQGRHLGAGRRGGAAVIKLPTAVAGDPDFKKDVDYYPDLSDNFFVGNSFPTCGINFQAQEIMKETKD